MKFVTFHTGTALLGMGILLLCQPAGQAKDDQPGNGKNPDYTVQQDGPIHEAFAAQVLCTLKAWEDPTFCRERLKREAPLGSVDRTKLNTVGGSVSLGHPFGATGARMVAATAKLLSEKGSGKALLSICTGGGMGTVAVLEK